MTFDELLKLLDCESRYVGTPSIRSDSRLVEPGDVFVALKGTVYDGHDFIEKAIINGAKYVVCEKYDRRNSSRCIGTIHDSRDTRCEIIVVDNTSKAAAELVQKKFNNPSSRLINLAVTGTNGKTTVTYLVRSVINNAGQKCGIIGTVMYDTGNSCCDPDVSGLTTPDCLTIAEKQSEMVKAGAKYMIIEASSHALAQNRLAQIDFKSAAFTNLTGDHLDYHKNEKNYLAAKSILFENLSKDATAVLNIQSPQAKKLAEKTKAHIIWYGINVDCVLSAQVKSMDKDKTVFTLQYAGQGQKVITALPGLHNVSNHLAAAGLCLSAGFDLQAIAAGLSDLKSVPGRLEKISYDGDFSVFVDYAHTDDALKNVLTTLRPICKGRLIVVFGCGGDRDTSKRPRMARVAEQLADVVVVTSDNPRTEKPEDIISQIVAGFIKSGPNKIIVEPDRRKAIALAIKHAAKDDIILLAGKGHETYQIIGSKKYDFSDKEVAQNYLSS